MTQLMNPMSLTVLLLLKEGLTYFASNQSMFEKYFGFMGTSVTSCILFSTELTCFDSV